jgi:hypothetical protein
VDEMLYKCVHCIELPGEPRLHFVVSPHTPPDYIEVCVTVGFGGTHLACIDDIGLTHEFPMGTAHFMEHFLFWQNLDRMKNLARKYAAAPNSVVTYDRTRWYLGTALLDQGLGRDEAARDIVQSLLSVLVGHAETNTQGATGGKSRSRAGTRRLIEHTVTDIANEIGYRHTGDYRMQLALLHAMYHNHPIRYDMLGSEESLGKIGMQHIELALDLIRTNILSITLVVHDLTEKFVDLVKQTVYEQLGQLHIRSLRPITNITEPHHTFRSHVAIKRPNYDLVDLTEVRLGIKLLPLRQAFPDPEECRRMYLVSYIAANAASRGRNRIRDIMSRDIGANRERNHITGIMSLDARAYFTGGVIHNNWFFWDPGEMAQVVREYKADFLQKLESYRIGFTNVVELAYGRIMDYAGPLMKFCLGADLFGYQLEELLDTFSEIRASHVEILIEEVRAAQKNISLVYASSYVDLV